MAEDDVDAQKGKEKAQEEERQRARESTPETTVEDEMEEFKHAFQGLTEQFELVDKIGSGTFSSVYKAVDKSFDKYDNSWLRECMPEDYDTDPSKPKYVALKRIYVTSSPNRIINELKLLHELRGSSRVVPLITAFRDRDQVVAVMPLLPHHDFQHHMRRFKLNDVRIYMQQLLQGLEFIHKRKIIHRDIKPANFLFDTARSRGVLVDFGLAEKEARYGCVCEKGGIEGRYDIVSQYGYKKDDQRPSRRANRAGTRGFRAPEVLLKCGSQTTKLDIWAAGVVLLCFLSKRFPFFESSDDPEALVELGVIFGRRNLQRVSFLHGAVYETNIPSIHDKPLSFEKVIRACTSTWNGAQYEETTPITTEHRKAIDLLAHLLTLDYRRRYTATQALQHSFFNGP
ncbi:hypothetical protein TRICI_005161 [Trichomonascus ciferrii]|uniref:non-specific serine/threonine protein kinase n=1 Tax=Trichomonascus ciferrii TaxID=44093 RepID=A0A642UXN2_9ASCO|nr:hypothetical protein TRICI_005161 [Trichomonascus ciferrii]